MKHAKAVQRVTEAPFLKLVSPDATLDHIKETFDTIARRAFEIFEANGRVLGRDWTNWLQAEAELLHPAHLDVIETDEGFTVRAEVPGFKEKDIEIDLEPRRLTITGARESRGEGRKGKTLYAERCANRIFRVVDLPSEVDSASSAVKATYDQGVLTIKLPKREQAKAREIKLESVRA